MYSPGRSHRSHLWQHPAQQHLIETLIWRFWRSWWRSCRETVPVRPLHHLLTAHTLRGRLHSPHSHIHHDTDLDLQTDASAKRRGAGSHAELRGVRMEWCQYMRYTESILISNRECTSFEGIQRIQAMPYWERLVCGRPRERLRRPGYYFVCNTETFKLCVLVCFFIELIIILLSTSWRWNR